MGFQYRVFIIKKRGSFLLSVFWDFQGPNLVSIEPSKKQFARTKKFSVWSKKISNNKTHQLIPLQLNYWNWRSLGYSIFDNIFFSRFNSLENFLFYNMKLRNWFNTIVRKGSTIWSSFERSYFSVFRELFKPYIYIS